MSEKNSPVSPDVSEQLADLRELVAEKLDNDAVREKAFDQLYEELRQYKEDFTYQAEKPLLLDLLLFYDSLNWFGQSIVKDEMSPDVVADSFQYLIDEFVELLYRRDVTPIDPSTTFDRTKQKAVKVVDAESEDDHHKVAQVLKRGFLRGDKLLRPEEVVIARWRKGD